MGVGRSRDLGNHHGFQLKDIRLCFPKQHNKCILDFFHRFLDLLIIPIVEDMANLEKVEYSPQA